MEEIKKTKRMLLDSPLGKIPIHYIEVGPLKRKIIDFTDMKDSGIVQIQPVKGKRFEGMTFTNYKRGGIFFGIPQEVNDQTGHIVWKRITITDNLDLNCDDQEQAMMWHVLRYHERVLGSPFLRNEALLKVHDKEAIAEAKIETFTMAERAMRIVREFMNDYASLADFARIIGYAPEHNSPKVLLTLVYERAMTDPKTFIESYDNPNRIAIEVFRRGLACGLITNNPINGYMYKEQMALGTSENLAIGFLLKNRSLMVAIDTDSRMRLRNSLHEYNVKDSNEAIRAGQLYEMQEQRKEEQKQFIPPQPPQNVVIDGEGELEEKEKDKEDDYFEQIKKNRERAQQVMGKTVPVVQDQSANLSNDEDWGTSQPQEPKKPVAKQPKPKAGLAGKLSK